MKIFRLYRDVLYEEHNYEIRSTIAAIRIWEFRSPPPPPCCCYCADSWRDLSITNFYRKKQMQKRRFLLCVWVPNRRIVNETSGRTFKQACFLADGSNWWHCNYVIVKRIAKSNFWQNLEESKRFRWCVRSEDQRESQERNQTMLLQRAQSQSSHSSTKM